MTKVFLRFSLASLLQQFMGVCGGDRGFGVSDSAGREPATRAENAAWCGSAGNGQWAARL